MAGTEIFLKMYCPDLADLPQAQNNKKGWPWTEGSFRATKKTLFGKPWPKISIVTPNYNYASYIEETIRSVLLQGYQDLEYIIIDDSS